MLHTNALGGVGGQVDTKQVCKAYGGTASVGLNVFVPCIDGRREVQVGQDGHITLGWQASGEVIGSPIVAGHTVYSVNHNTGMFYALNLSDGTTRFSLSVGKTSRFITPTPANGYIFIGTLNGIVALSAA